MNTAQHSSAEKNRGSTPLLDERMESPASSRPSSPAAAILQAMTISSLLSPLTNSQPGCSTGQLVDRLITEALEPASSSDESVVDKDVFIKKKKTIVKSSKAPCSYVIKRGDRKGHECGKPIGKDGVFCSQHTTRKPKETLQCEKLVNSNVSEKQINAKKVRINKIKPNKKYIYKFSQTIKNCNKWGIFTCDGKYFKIRIPAKMGIPDGNGIYLWKPAFSQQVHWEIGSY